MKWILAILLVLLSIFSCSESDTSDLLEEEWLVDRDDVTGKFNLFPLASQLKFKSVNDVNLNDNDLVALINFGSEIRAYPYTFTNHFEIINDVFNTINIAVSYCPITKSGICFDRKRNDKISNFRASGYLYNDNLMPFDENTESIWSQMRQQAVFGALKGSKFKTYNLIETKWSTVKENFKSAKIFVGNINEVSSSALANAPPNPEGEDDNSGAPGGGSYVYGVFKDNSLESLGIFEYGQFKGTKVYDFVVNNRSVIVVGDDSKRIISSYFIEEKGQFEALSDEFPIVMINKNNGSKYNIFGLAISGLDTGKRLESTKSFVAIWWAWKEFYQNFQFNDVP